MIHAYLLQSCGYKSAFSSGKGHDLGHGDEFVSIAFIIKKTQGLFSQYSDTENSYNVRGRRLELEYNDHNNEQPLLPAPVAASDCQKAGLGSLSHRYKRLFERVKLNTEVPRIDLEKDCPKDEDEFRRSVGHLAF